MQTDSRIDAEENVLGCVLLSTDPASVVSVLEMLGGSDLFRERQNIDVFLAMSELRKAKITIDILTVAQCVVRRDGGVGLLTATKRICGFVDRVESAEQIFPNIVALIAK